MLVACRRFVVDDLPQLVQHFAADEKPQLLFSDLIMPGDTGGCALAIKVPSTTVFAGSSDGKNADEGAEFGIIKKPCRLADLARRVRVMLDGPTGNPT